MIGELPDNILDAILETLPIEFSVIDKDDRVLAWNKHNERLFKRPTAVFGRNVRDCHPKKSLHKVEKLLNEMKDGKRERARFWIEMNIEGNKEKQKILIEYYAIRDSDGNYLGCLESTQNITDIQKLTGEKRLLD